MPEQNLSEKHEHGAREEVRVSEQIPRQVRKHQQSPVARHSLTHQQRSGKNSGYGLLEKNFERQLTHDTFQGDLFHRYEDYR
jgi:hypothetical protein